MVASASSAAASELRTRGRPLPADCALRFLQRPHSDPPWRRHAGAMPNNRPVVSAMSDAKQQPRWRRAEMSGGAARSSGSAGSIARRARTAISQPDDAAKRHEQPGSRSAAAASSRPGRRRSLAHGDLLPRALLAHEQQVGDVRARDQQHESDRAESTRSAVLQLTRSRTQSQHRDRLTPHSLTSGKSHSPSVWRHAFISVCACSWLIPALSRPNTTMTWLSRISFAEVDRERNPHISSGERSVSDAGATPTKRVGECCWGLRGEPTTAGSCPEPSSPQRLR